MAEILLDPRYEAFAAMVLGRLTVNGAMELTPHSRDLIRFSAEAWLADASLVPLREEGALRSKSLGDLNEIQQALLASEIVDRVKVDPHVRQHVVQNQRVPFSSLFVALADAGRSRLREEVKKGF